MIPCYIALLRLPDHTSNAGISYQFSKQLSKLNTIRKSCLLIPYTLTLYICLVANYMAVSLVSDVNNEPFVSRISIEYHSLLVSRIKTSYHNPAVFRISTICPSFSYLEQSCIPFPDRVLDRKLLSTPDCVSFHYCVPLPGRNITCCM